MANTGRKRKPDSLKVVEGTFRKDRSNPNAPEVSKESPKPPAFLDDDGKKWFKHIVDRLDTLGLSSESYSYAIGLAAARMAEVQACNDDIKAHGRVYETTNSYGDTAVKNNPAVAQRSEAMRHLQSLLAEFGMTPATLTKVSVPGREKDRNPFADLHG